MTRARRPRSTPTPVDTPDVIMEVYTAHRQVHPYGIADVAQLWDRSQWWRDGPAVAGIVDLPGSPVPVLYAVSATRAGDAPTRELVARLDPVLPERLVAHGPRGLCARLDASYAPVWRTDYVKSHLADPAALGPPDPRARPLSSRDVAAVEALFATDPLAGDFFHPALLEAGRYVGVEVDAHLVAVAGTHVIDRDHRVAALANIATHPAHRRRGLGRATVAALCHDLLEDVDVIGLNVAADNLGARSLYAGLGFAGSTPFEEAEILRRQS